MTPMSREEDESQHKGRARWLDTLLNVSFFDSCQQHLSHKKNECNIYCIDCCAAGICQHCLPSHAGHQLLQVRRYVYHDVVRLQDIDQLVDCTGVQTYLINNARVIFLKQRPQSRPTKGAENLCETCRRGLQHPFTLCSVACKVEQLAARGERVTKDVGAFIKEGSEEGEVYCMPVTMEGRNNNNTSAGAAGSTDSNTFHPRTPDHDIRLNKRGHSSSEGGGGEDELEEGEHDSKKEMSKGNIRKLQKVEGGGGTEGVVGGVVAKNSLRIDMMSASLSSLRAALTQEHMRTTNSENSRKHMNTTDVSKASKISMMRPRLTLDTASDHTSRDSSGGGAYSPGSSLECSSSVSRRRKGTPARAPVV
mmetsp:Transcript_40373/g.48944  ORF Transcript_40373/g.48944 Transcript_40373/m.48944 type:complete len:364 (+) Transcript_40373:195-1286(+)